MEVLKNQLNNLLTKAAKILNITNYAINLNLDVSKGDGFLGESYRASIIDQDTKKIINLFIKKAPVNEKRRHETVVELAYKQEIFFYSTVLPLLEQLQEEHRVTQPFNNFLKYVTSERKLEEEMIVFEDISKIGYQMRQKDLILDAEHAKFVFETYGRFHALSFCLKNQKREEYLKIVDNFEENVVAEFGKRKGFSSAMSKLVTKSFNSISNDSIREKFRKYAENTMEEYAKATHYEGEYSCILHGDCWSNNIMFKYDQNEKLEDVKLIDFQLSWIGTPVYDLSYFFYSGGSKNLFRQLDFYLDIYYNSFCKFAKELGNDPAQLLTRKVLREDWKKYAKLGMFMAILLTQVKLMSKEASVELTDNLAQNDGEGSKLTKVKIREDLFEERVRDIIEHMYDYGAL